MESCFLVLYSDYFSSSVRSKNNIIMFALQLRKETILGQITGLFNDSCRAERPSSL